MTRHTRLSDVIHYPGKIYAVESDPVKRKRAGDCHALSRCANVRVMASKTSFTFPLTETQRTVVTELLRNGNYRAATVPYTTIAADGPDCRIALYTSGKLVVQGKGAQEWVTFTLEPEVLLEARLGYEEVRNPDSVAPHMGIDESGKGDFFGPMVIAGAYFDASLAARFQELNVRDSKTISSDRVAEQLAAEIMRANNGRHALVTIGNPAYNRLYTSMGSVNLMLAWGHARAIENLLDRVPECPPAPQGEIRMKLVRFGPPGQIIRGSRPLPASISR